MPFSSRGQNVIQRWVPRGGMRFDVGEAFVPDGFAVYMQNCRRAGNEVIRDIFVPAQKPLGPTTCVAGAQDISNPVIPGPGHLETRWKGKRWRIADPTSPEASDMVRFSVSFPEDFHGNPAALPVPVPAELNTMLCKVEPCYCTDVGMHLLVGDDSTKVTALAQWNDLLVIFKEEDVFVMENSSVFQMGARPLIRGIGTYGPRWVWQDSDGVFFVTERISSVGWAPNPTNRTLSIWSVAREPQNISRIVERFIAATLNDTVEGWENHVELRKEGDFLYLSYPFLGLPGITGPEPLFSKSVWVVINIATGDAHLVRTDDLDSVLTLPSVGAGGGPEDERAIPLAARITPKMTFISGSGNGVDSIQVTYVSDLSFSGSTASAIITTGAVLPSTIGTVRHDGIQLGDIGRTLHVKIIWGSTAVRIMEVYSEATVHSVA